MIFERDLTRLFLAINMTHRASTIGVVCLDQIAVQLNLLKVKQWSKETLSALETRIKFLAKDVTGNGLPAYTDQQLAGIMFRALDDEYSNIMNAEILQPGNYPKSTSDVLKLAEKWVAPHVDTDKEDDSDDDVLSVDPGVDNNTCEDEDHDDVNNSGEDEDNDDVYNSGEDKNHDDVHNSDAEYSNDDSIQQYVVRPIKFAN